MNDQPDRQTKSWPPSKAAFEEMEPSLEYGAQFTWVQILPWMGLAATKEKPEGWDMLGEWITLKGLIEEQGYLVTERGMNGAGFRLLAREEMADVVRQREKKQADASIRRCMILSKVPREGLTDEECLKLDRAEAMSAMLGATQKALLARKKLPDVEMVVKTVKSIR